MIGIDLSGRRILVTAAGSGIGRASARAMARAGADVIVTDRDATSAEETAAQIAADGGMAVAHVLDVSDPNAIETMIAQAAAGGLHGLHNHAGVQVSGGLDTLDDAGFIGSVDINLTAILRCCRSALPHLVETKGAILNTASNAGVFVDRGMLAYNTTKAALVTMTKQMAVDLGAHEVRVNAICPGWVDTPFNAPYEAQLGGRDALEAVIRKGVPLGRFGKAEEVANVAAFLMSDLAAYITGQAIVVDGGEAIAAAST